MLRRPRRRPRASNLRLFDVLEPRQLLSGANLSVTATPAYVQDPPPPYDTSVTVEGDFTTKADSAAQLIDYTITLQPASTQVEELGYYDSTGNLIQSMSPSQLSGRLTTVVNDAKVLPNANTDIKATFEYTGYDSYENPEDPIGSPKQATVTLAAPLKHQVSPFCSNCSPLSGTSSPASGDSVPDAMSDAGVDYGTGGISPRSPSLLGSDGYGSIPMGFDLGWTNLAGFDGGSLGSPFGNGMTNSDLPYLASDPAGYYAVGNAGNAVQFVDATESGRLYQFSSTTTVSRSRAARSVEYTAAAAWDGPHGEARWTRDSCSPSRA